ncbi:AMP-dependent synthetase/ligase [Gleimia sp. 6138-11-ORH1]|uniref:AMP-dependent synthetase/ligase n=1 Tax=Gleimia sp. 6138-11-ORH1 TaxID=2973937 RepID=UPI0021677098|nr:AMP-dependent synthetase/ligase [Gleimia sp. 6138-11-ORH1]MCS4484161.1 AMP-dependent synthetase/ligase [Gleimia sp. 6138-11-ORH1]
MLEDTLAQASAAEEDQPKTTTEVLEWHGPVLEKTEMHMTIPWMIRRRIQRSPKAPIIARKTQMGANWRNISGVEFLEEVNTVARGLIGMGLERGDAIAIMSHTRYEWTLLDVAAWSAGLVVVPIYETSSVDQVAHILQDAQVKLIVVETMILAQLVQAARTSSSGSLKVLSLDNSALLKITAAAQDVPLSEVEARIEAMTIADLATIVYTSGTTGLPKGVELSHGNFTVLAHNGHSWMGEVANHKRSRLLLFLPLAHVYARFLEVFQLTGQGILAHTPNIKNLLTDLESFRPSYLLGVPRVLEKIYNSAEQAASSGMKLKTFRWAVATAIAYSKALDTAEGPSKTLRAQHRLADILVYRKLKDLLGGNCKYVVSGGGPLGERLGHFYRGLGIIVLEGYGLTETVGPLSVNTPRVSKIGTVGPPISTVGVRISDEGEILVKGPTVFRGYHNMPAETDECFTQGWFKTGDIGYLDRDGYLRITGRAKELIVTAGGKNVAPAALEDPLRAHPLVSQVVVVGDQRPFIAALLTLDSEMLPGWLANHGLPPMTVSEAAQHSEVLQALHRAVERANESVSRAESIRKITILDTDFTEANGFLTPSMKVKRRAVHEAFATEIDKIYGGPIPDENR